MQREERGLFQKTSFLPLHYSLTTSPVSIDLLQARVKATVSLRRSRASGFLTGRREMTASMKVRSQMVPKSTEDLTLMPSSFSFLREFRHLLWFRRLRRLCRCRKCRRSGRWSRDNSPFWTRGCRRSFWNPRTRRFRSSSRSSWWRLRRI